MPKGVICAGAVDGSNQLGAMVTCHAMTDSPLCARASPAHGAPATRRSTTATTMRRERVIEPSLRSGPERYYTGTMTTKTLSAETVAEAYLLLLKERGID